MSRTKIEQKKFIHSRHCERSEAIQPSRRPHGQSRDGDSPVGVERKEGSQRDSETARVFFSRPTTDRRAFYPNLSLPRRLAVPLSCCDHPAHPGAQRRLTLGNLGNPDAALPAHGVEQEAPPTLLENRRVAQLVHPPIGGAADRWFQRRPRPLPVPLRP